MSGADGQFAKISELADVGDQCHEVYARYGLAMYFAQVFEHGLINLVTMAEMAAGITGTGSDYDARFDALAGQTAGQLVRAVERSQTLASADLDLCARAKFKRNRLAHDFFRDHSKDFITANGRQRMLDDADAARELLLAADEAATRVMFDLAKAFGITPDLTESVAERLRQEVRGRESEC